MAGYRKHEAQHRTTLTKSWVQYSATTDSGSNSYGEYLERSHDDGPRLFSSRAGISLPSTVLIQKVLYRSQDRDSRDYLITVRGKVTHETRAGSRNYVKHVMHHTYETYSADADQNP